MRKLNKGQACLSNSPIIGQETSVEYAVKTDTDIGISDMYRETIQQRHERIISRYNEMLEKKAEKFVQGCDSIYNLRILNYPHGQQLTHYNNPVEYHRKPHENLSRNYQSRERTEEEQKHCINVSLARTKNTVYNIARSHNWRWFVTFTFNREKTDAGDFSAVMKRMSKNLRNTKQRKCPDLKYILVPELHLDKTNYHFHGLFAGCDELKFVFSGHFDKSGRPVFNIPNWRWGFSTATLIDDSAAASSYICKYITKETERYLYGQRRYLSNAPKTQAEKYLVENSRHEIIAAVADDIRYMKDVTVKAAHRKCTYIELPPDTMEVYTETSESLTN